ncbi:hypothetical protein IW262DRAFT_1467735 [Armillaria fumosa]|nr:hypothetical protein IW262DRAFT_1467735 [Armillaria fumosa]
MFKGLTLICVPLCRDNVSCLVGYLMLSSRSFTPRQYIVVHRGLHGFVCGVPPPIFTSRRRTEICSETTYRRPESLALQQVPSARDLGLRQQIAVRRAALGYAVKRHNANIVFLDIGSSTCPKHLNIGRPQVYPEITLRQRIAVRRADMTCNAVVAEDYFKVMCRPGITLRLCRKLRHDPSG